MYRPNHLLDGFKQNYYFKNYSITIEYLQSNEYTCVINETCITQNLINIIS